MSYYIGSQKFPDTIFRPNFDGYLSKLLRFLYKLHTRNVKNVCVKMLNMIRHVGSPHLSLYVCSDSTWLE